jgi:NAD(P)-dependent dehydrogenase (short-subunit alcohol dehydrogenase family)
LQPRGSFTKIANMLRASLETALVTGAARRIGREIALDLGRRGWSVAVHYRSGADEAESVAAAIRAAGGRAVALAADLAREADTSSLVERAAEAIGPIGLLVNNASLFESDLVDTATRDSWDRHLETNLRAPFVLTQRFARQLPDGERGNVINLLDQRVWNLTPYFVSYTVSKSALWTLTRTLALALAPRIRVNAIGPGPTLRSTRQSEQDFARQAASTPLGHGTTPEEIARAVQFIVESESLTGQMIALDGGQHLGWAQAPLRDAPRE